MKKRISEEPFTLNGKKIKEAWFIENNTCLVIQFEDESVVEIYQGKEQLNICRSFICAVLHS